MTDKAITLITKFTTLSVDTLNEYLMNMNVSFLMELDNALHCYPHLTKVLLIMHNNSSFLVSLINAYVSRISTFPLTQYQQLLISLIKHFTNNNTIPLYIYNHIYSNLSSLYFFSSSTEHSLSSSALSNYITLLQALYSYNNANLLTKYSNTKSLSSPATTPAITQFTFPKHYFYFNGDASLSYTPSSPITQNKNDGFMFITYIYLHSPNNEQQQQRTSIVTLTFDNNKSKQLELYINNENKVNFSYQNTDLYNHNNTNDTFTIPYNQWLQFRITQITFHEKLIISKHLICVDISDIQSNMSKTYETTLTNKTFQWETITHIESFTNLNGYAGNTLLITQSNKFIALTSNVIPPNNIYITTNIIENIITKNKQVIACVIAPMYYNESKCVVKERITNDDVHLITSSSMYNNVMRIPSGITSIINAGGGVNTIFPCFEMVLTLIEHECNRDIMISNVIVPLLQLVCEIAFRKKRNFTCVNDTFYQCMALFFESLHREYFTKEVFDVFKLFYLGYVYNYHKCIKNKNCNVKMLTKYVERFVLNEEILMKFTIEQQVELMNEVLSACKERHIHVCNVVSWSKIYNLLLCYDKQCYNEMCCEAHSKIFNNRSKCMVPPLQQRISPIIEMIKCVLHDEQYVSSISTENTSSNVNASTNTANANDNVVNNNNNEMNNSNYEEHLLISLMKLLVMDISPCLRVLILNMLKTAIIKENAVQLLLQHNIVDILSYNMKVGLFDSKRKTFQLMQAIHIEHKDILDKYVHGLNVKHSKSGYDTSLFAFMKYNLTYNTLCVSNNSNNNNNSFDSEDSAELEMEIIETKVDEKQQLLVPYINTSHECECTEVGCSFYNDINTYWLYKGSDDNDLANAIEVLSKHCVEYKMKYQHIVGKRLCECGGNKHGKREVMNYIVSFPMNTNKVSLHKHNHNHIHDNTVVHNNNNNNNTNINDNEDEIDEDKVNHHVIKRTFTQYKTKRDSTQRIISINDNDNKNEETPTTESVITTTITPHIPRSKSIKCKSTTNLTKLFPHQHHTHPQPTRTLSQELISPILTPSSLQPSLQDNNLSPLFNPTTSSSSTLFTTYINHTSSQPHLKHLYNQIQSNIHLPHIQQSETLSTNIQDLLLRYVLFSKNPQLLLSYLNDIKHLLFPTTPITDTTSYAYIILYYYTNKHFYQFLLETMFQCTLIINCDEYPFPYHTLGNTRETLIDIITKVYYKCREIHKEIAYVKDKLPLIKNNKKGNNSVDIIKSPKMQMEMMFNMGMYIKSIFNGAVCELVDDFIQILIMDGMSYYGYVIFEILQKQVAYNEHIVMNYIEFINYIYEYIFFYKHLYKDNCSSHTHTHTVNDNNSNTNDKSFINSGLFSYLQQHFPSSSSSNYLNSKWSDYKLVKLLITGLSPIWSFQHELSNMSDDVSSNINEVNTVLHTNLFKRRFKGSFSNEIDILSLTPPNNTSLPFVQIINTLLITSLHLCENNSERNEILNHYEHFYIYILVLSTNHFRKPQSHQTETSCQLFIDVLLYGLSFLFYNAYALPNSPPYAQTYQNTLATITYIIGQTVEVTHHKDEKLISFMKKTTYFNTPIIKLFKEHFLFEETEKTANGKERTIYNSIIPIKGVSSQTFTFADIHEGYKHNINSIKDKLLYDPAFIERYYKYFDVERYKKVFVTRMDNVYKVIPIYNYSDVVSCSGKFVVDNNYAEKEYFNERTRVLAVIKGVVEDVKGNERKFEDKAKFRNVKKRNAYKKLKQRLFMWNGPWSDNNVYYKDKCKMKQKIVNHYTYDFQMPFMAPIVDVSYYLPKFVDFKADSLFLDNKANTSYRVVLDVNKIFKQQQQCKGTNDNNICNTNNDLVKIYKYCFDGQIWDMYTKQDYTYNNSNNSVKKYKCCLVKASNHLFGEITINISKCKFKQCTRTKNEQDNDKHYQPSRGVCCGSIFAVNPRDELFTSIAIPYTTISIIFKRKYYYRNSALEIFTNYNKSYYFNFLTQSDRDSFIKDICATYKTITLKEIKIDSKTKDDAVVGYINKYRKPLSNFLYFKTFSKVIDSWVHCKISNYHMLMLCNFISGRSFRDISQYPVYPWTLQNFSQENTINKHTDLRDYTVPVGMFHFDDASLERCNTYRTLFDMVKGESTDDYDLSEAPYVYGSHYSNPMYVAHYLTRVFPFCHLAVELQGNKFDDPNRLFKSVPHSFRLASSQKCDVRELIPEFFYLSEMYFNINNLNLYLEEPDVELPKFAKGKGYLLTTALRKSIEYDNADVHCWIDLIFGYKQKGKKAEEAYNVFMSHSYDGNVDLDKIDNDKELLCKYGLFELGVNPMQIINYKMPKRNDMPERGMQLQNNKIQLYPLKMITNYKNDNTKKTNNAHALNVCYEPLCYECIDKERVVIVYSNYMKFHIKVNDKSQDIMETTFTRFIKEIPITFPIKASSSTKQPSVIYNKTITCQGGYYGGYVSVFYINDKKEDEVKLFRSPISNSIVVAVAIDNTCIYGITGDEHGIVTIYNVCKTEWNYNTYLPNHSTAITSLVVNNYLNALVTAAYDGLVNIYTLGKFQYVRSIRLNNIKYASDVFVSNCPIPCVIAYNKDDNVMEGFTVNGSEIDICHRKAESNVDEEDMNTKVNGKVSAFCYYKDEMYNDYLITGTDKGCVVVYAFPTMDVVSVKEVKKDKAVLMIIAHSLMEIVVFVEGNECVVMTTRV